MIPQTYRGQFDTIQRHVLAKVHCVIPGEEVLVEQMGRDARAEEDGREPDPESATRDAVLAAEIVEAQMRSMIAYMENITRGPKQ